MPRSCTICAHPKRIEIDAALMASESFRNIAARFGISTGALQRHRSQHIATQLAKAQAANEITAASALVKELKELTRKTGAVLARALRSKNGELALKAIARLERQLELKGRLLGQLEGHDSGRGGDTRIEVVYVDARKLEIDATTPTFPHGLGVSKSNELTMNDLSTCDPLLAQQNVNHADHS